MKSRAHPTRGFTMIELMVTLAIAAVLLTLVAPSFTDQLARRRLEGAATELSTDLQFTRSLAVSSSASAALTTNAGGTGYEITPGPSKRVALDAQLSVTPNLTVSYDSLRAMAAASSVMTLSSSKTTGQLQVSVSPMGRVSMCSPSGSLKGYTAC